MLRPFGCRCDRQEIRKMDQIGGQPSTCQIVHKDASTDIEMKILENGSNYIFDLSPVSSLLHMLHGPWSKNRVTLGFGHAVTDPAEFKAR